MKQKYSVSFQVAGKNEVRNGGVISHNNRNFYAKNVDRSRTKDNIYYKQEDIKKKYDELFGAAVTEYNLEQTRVDRKINNYFEKIKNSKKERLFQEIIVEFGNMNEVGVGTEEWEVMKNLCDEYMRKFEKRNPNMKVFNAVLHLDEANPHLHIDFIPIGHKKAGGNGLPVKVSMKQALCEQGFIPSSRKENGLTFWEESEREFMTEILRRHNLERDYKDNHRKHLTIGEFKAQCAEFEKEKIKAEKKNPILRFWSERARTNIPPRKFR